MDPHKSPSKPFQAKNPPCRLAPLLPLLLAPSTSPPSQSDPRPGTEGTGLPSTAHGSGSGDNRSRGPCRALQLQHTHIPPTRHTPQADGESTQSSLREKWGDRDCDSSELHSPFPSLFSTSPPSPLLQATSCTCDTTDSLMLHYTYTSLSLSAPLRAMFPDVASKLGHEHDTRRRRKRMEVGTKASALCSSSSSSSSGRALHVPLLVTSTCLTDNLIKYWMSSKRSKPVRGGRGSLIGWEDLKWLVKDMQICQGVMVSRNELWIKFDSPITKYQL